MADVACLLDVLMQGEGFHSGLISQGICVIGVSGQRSNDISVEEEALFFEVQDCLRPLIGSSDLRLDSYKQIMENNDAWTIMNAELKAAWKDYLYGVAGPIRCLEDLVQWHSNHPVGSTTVNDSSKAESFYPSNPGQHLLQAALMAPPLPSGYADSIINSLKTEVMKLMDLQNLDAIMFPGVGTAPFLAAVAGLPIVG